MKVLFKGPGWQYVYKTRLHCIPHLLPLLCLLPLSLLLLVDDGTPAPTPSCRCPPCGQVLLVSGVIVIVVDSGGFGGGFG